MAATVATPLERSLGRIAGVTEMTSTQLARLDARHAAVRPRRDIDGAARDVQAAINAARSLLPTGLPEQSDLPQGQPGRRADHDPRAHVGHDDAGADVRRRVDDPRAEALAGRRRRPGDASAAARCRRCASSSIRTALNKYGIGFEDVRTALASANANRPKGVGRGRRPALADLRQRPGEDGGRVPAADRRLPQRRAGAALRRRRGRRLGAGPAQRRLGQRQAVGAAHHQPPAERQHHRDGRPRHARCCRSCARRSRARSTSTSAMERTTTIRASLRDVERTLVIAIVLVILVVFLFLRNCARDADPERRGAGVADRHLRRHVPRSASRSTTFR